MSAREWEGSSRPRNARPASCHVAIELRAPTGVRVVIMKTSVHHSTAPFPTDLQELNGRIVLVKSSRDHRSPPTAMRGWIEVPAMAKSGTGAAVVVEFPQMFSSVAHHRIFRLSEPALEQLLASERNGIFEFTIDDDLA